MAEFTITYEKVGTRKSDFVVLWAGSFVEAIQMFCSVTFECCGLPFKYNSSAILGISVLEVNPQ